MKGVLFKYNANPKDPLLKDRRDEKLCRGFVDPDFWSRDLGIWSVCGPYIRNSVDKGDIIFFLPCKNSWEKAGLSDYICTGMLGVGEQQNKDQLLDNAEIIQQYKTNYKISLEKHLQRDKKEAPRTERIRDKNIIIGSEISKWFGKNNYLLKDILNQLHINIDVSARIIKRLSNEECKTLYDFYNRRF